jgi:hypothetical protein
MTNALRAPFTAVIPGIGPAGLAPYLSLVLTAAGKSIRADGLVDSGSAISVLPHRMGLALGYHWDQTPGSVQLAGTLAAIPARPIFAQATVGAFAPVRLVFAWAQSDQVPVILGRVNFFLEFDVCFFFSQDAFEVKPK